MRKPIVGVIGNAHSIHDILSVQHVGEHSLLCISEVADALPLMFAGCPAITDIDALLDTVDGILLTGARANVHPSCFGVDPDVRYEPYDRNRDAIALPLVRACTDRGVPLLGICRGLQEMNVAFGGSLHPEVRELPDRMNHRAPRAEDGSLHRDPLVVFADRHEVRFEADGVFARTLWLPDNPRELVAWSGHPRAWRSRCRGRCGRGRHDRSDTHRWCFRIRFGCPVACRSRRAHQRCQSGPLSGIWSLLTRKQPSATPDE